MIVAQDTIDAFALADARLPVALSSLLSHFASPPSPSVGIVCGSGLAGLAEALEDVQVVGYDKIEGWPKGRGGEGVVGHGKGLAFGKVAGKQVVCQMGRMHCYEGYPVLDVCFAVRMFRLLGCSTVLVTNAAGAVNTEMKIGQIMALHDHLSLPSLTAMNPLIGPNFEAVGPRFPPMSDAYDFELRRALFRAARKIGLPKGDVTEGTYAWVAGPTYETRAEGRFIRAAGADVVGMSTVPEVIAARHAGLRVLALSLVTNIVVWSPYRSAELAVDAESSSTEEGKGKEGNVENWKEETANHEEVLQVGREKAAVVVRLVKEVVASVP